MSKSAALKIALPSDRGVVMTRDFDAPRELVFDAFTRPELLKRWLAAPGRRLEVCDIDLRVGGAYRYVWRGPGKHDVGMHGIYREVVAPERYVRTEAWEDWDAGELLVTAALVQHGRITTLTSTSIFPSREVRDAVLKAGMEHGAGESFDTLAELLASIASGNGERR